MSGGGWPARAFVDSCVIFSPRFLQRVVSSVTGDERESGRWGATAVFF